MSVICPRCSNPLPADAPMGMCPICLMADALPERLCYDGYELLSEIGRGGMGIVYKARQTKLNRIVALKVMRPDLDPKLLPRFRIEAQAIARLQHPNIVQIHDVGLHEEKPFLALELLDGGSLADRPRGDPQPPRDAAALVEMLARAVQHAHERGVVHRDLKPANVLLAADGTPKITDFGLAKKLDEPGQTRPGDVMGTLAYMAPEQLAGRPDLVGPPTDVYALGAILYERLTGRPPFLGASVLLKHVVSDEPVPPSKRKHNVPKQLETVCLDCLKKAPMERPEAGELAERLHHFLNKGATQTGQPVQDDTQRLEVVSPPRRWSRPRVALAVVAVVALIVLLGFRPWSFWPLMPNGPDKLLPDLVVDKKKDKNRVPPLDQHGKNGIGMQFELIKGRKFQMGSPKEEKGRGRDEDQHWVEITRDYYLGVYEVTQGQYKKVTGKNPSYFSKTGEGKDDIIVIDGDKKVRVKDLKDLDLDDFPVETVSWHDAQEFLRELNKQEKTKETGWEYRLPTEAQWECGCRAGQQGYRMFNFGNERKALSFGFANYTKGESGFPWRMGMVKGKDKPYRENPSGLHDMHGNVWEWCEDWYSATIYSEENRTDPKGRGEGTERVVRGGAWNGGDADDKLPRSARRSHDKPDRRMNDLGFRVALVPAP